jgi:hypothetical protein
MVKQINFKTKDGKEIKFSNLGKKKEGNKKIKELEKRIKMMEKHVEKTVKKQSHEVKANIEKRAKISKHKVGLKNCDTPDKFSKWKEEGEKLKEKPKENKKIHVSAAKNRKAHLAVVEMIRK